MKKIYLDEKTRERSAAWHGDIRIAELAAWLVTSQSAPKDGVF